MKRMLTLLAAMMLLLTTFPASAESLFSLLPASQTDPIPNYGLMAGVDPASEETLEDGSTRYHYANVAAQSFLDFGTLLGEKGYAIDPNSMKVEGSAQTMNLVKEDIVFTVLYDQVALTLVVTYPEGANVEVYEEPDPFEGYIILNRNEQLHIKSDIFQGTFTLTKGERKGTILTYSSGSSINDESGVLLTFDVYNKGLSGIGMSTLLSNPTLHFINDDNHYMYPMYIFSRATHNPNVYYETAHSKFRDGVSSLSSNNIFFAINNLPNAVLNENDCTLAVTFTFVPTNTNYIYYIVRPAE